MDYDAVASTLEQDLAGRDYTINAMAYDPLEAVTILAFRNHFANRALEDPLTVPSPLDDPPGIERLALEVVAWPQDPRSPERVGEAWKATRSPWMELWRPLVLLWAEARSNTW